MPSLEGIEPEKEDRAGQQLSRAQSQIEAGVHKPQEQHRAAEVKQREAQGEIEVEEVASAVVLAKAGVASGQSLGLSRQPLKSLNTLLLRCIPILVPEQGPLN